MLKIGSIWRKWDFHVHTPYSFLNNGFGDCSKEETWDNYVRTLFNKAVKMSISAVFITDYFIVDGYEKVLEILNDTKRLASIFASELVKDAEYLNKVQSIAIFPNIEFRTNNQIDKNKMQYHILFSNELNPNLIKKHLLSQLSVESGGKKYYLSIDEIKQYGEVCKQKGIGTGLSDDPLKVGFVSIYVDLQEVKRKLENDKAFEGKYIFVTAEEDINKISWAGQTGSLREMLYNLAKARFSASPHDIDWGLTDACVGKIGHKLPCLWGSDSHDLKSLLEPTANHYCWIKADLTFKGLIDSLEIPEERVFVGLQPLELVKQQTRKGYSIKSATIFGTTDESKNHWINETIPLNPSMVSIIGNKGSGKSALSDILGFLGNSSKYEHFSFLNNDRFFDKTNAFSKDYVGSLEFCDGQKTDNKEIKYKGYDESLPELLTYLPQNYIETTCNQVDKKFFIKEINRLIFSYLDDVDKEGFDGLDDLIEYMFKDLDNKILSVRYEISELNGLIVKKERMKTSQYLRELNVSKKEVEKKIDNHNLAKPVEMIKPESEENSPLFGVLEDCSSLLDTIIKEHHNKFILYKEKEKELTSINDINQKTKEYKEGVEIINSLYKDHFDVYKPELAFSWELKPQNEKVFKEYYEKLCSDYNAIKETLYKNDRIFEEIDLANITIEKIKQTLNVFKKYFEKEDYLKKVIKTISDSLGQEQSAYQQNQENIKKWKAELERLQTGDGDIYKEGSLKSITEKIHYVQNDLNGDLEKLRQDRKTKIVELYNLLFLKKEKLKNLYAPVQTKLDETLDKDNDKVSFDSRIVSSVRLPKTIDDLINHRVTSVFKEYADIVTLVSETEFNNSESVIAFVETIINRVDEDIDLFYQNLLKDSNGQKDFYDYISNLSYLDVQFSLKMNEKTLEQLSPGEKGVVLLIFYLALDKNNKPLIIDQPEDNLDNQSIYIKLTSLIKYAKRNRQIIVVTHNPNIAVACDSEQIIYASINQDTNVITYESGSIEDQIMSKHIVDVLEGTMPAFNYRESKYHK